MNSSNVFSNTSRSDETHLYETLGLAQDIIEYLTIFFGIPLNLWVLLAVMTSRELRSRMRNKVISSFCLLHLLDSLVFRPMQVDALRGFGRHMRLNCHYFSALHHIYLMQDFISNWTLVLLVVTFFSQVCDYKPHAGFTKLATVIGSYAVLAFPWVASLITIPAVTSSTFYAFLNRKNISDYDGCIFPTFDSHRIIWWLDTTLPLLFAGALLVTAVVLRRRRFTRGFAKGMQVELIDRGPEIDDHYGYTAAIVVTLVCDFPTLYIIFDYYIHSWTAWLILNFTAYMLSLTKIVFIPLNLLFFPDIRERLKTWRPWHCPKPGIDMTLVYKNTIQ